jgi:autotransporter-associated beta strand protein
MATIEPINGTLVFSGSLQNGAAGLIQPLTGSQITVSLGLAANYGTINLMGGVFDNNSFALNNAGEIAGYGTLRTGGLTNHATITLTGAVSTVNGPVTNASGGSISVSYNPAIFTGAVVNNGFVKTTGTTVTWAGGFTNNATYLSDPAVNYFSSLANDAGGLVKGGNGDQFFVTGPLTNAGQIDLGGSSQMAVNNGAGLLTQTGGQLEIGTGAALSAGTVAINGGTILADGPGGSITANLLYASSSASTYQGVLAGSGDSLSVNNASAVLVLSGSGNSYTGGTTVTSGELIVGNPGGIADGTPLSVGSNIAAFGAAVVPPANAAAAVMPVPEPSTLALLALGTCGAVASLRKHLRRRRL